MAAPGCLHHAAERGIEVVLLTESGGLGARLASPSLSDPQARRAQYKVADDEKLALAAASTFVTGKLANMRTAILRAALRERYIIGARTVEERSDYWIVR